MLNIFRDTRQQGAQNQKVQSRGYLRSKIFHVGPELTEQVIALVEEGQMCIHEGQHLRGTEGYQLRGVLEAKKGGVLPTFKITPQGLKVSNLLKMEFFFS